MKSPPIGNIDSQSGYNLSLVQNLRFWRRAKIAAKIVAILLILAIPLGLFVNYLANTPRERATIGYSYWKRVVYGFKLNARLIVSSITSPEADPKTTPLPILEIYLRQDRLNALRSHLPQSGKVYQDGFFRVRRLGEKDTLYKASVRFRGDSINHWAFPQKSWRVKLRKNAAFQGMRYFNLYLPRSRTQITDFLGYSMANKMGGLVVPEAFPVHFRLNRNFDGLRVFLEQVNRDFIQNHKLNAQALLIGDIDFADVYGDRRRDRLFESINGWEILTPPGESSKGNENNARRAMQSLIGALALSTTDQSSFVREIQRVIDVPMFLKYMAFLEIVNSTHVDETHNQKIYLDSSDKILRPIVWDPVPYYWGVTSRMDLAPNKLFRALLLVPEFREQKDRYIWEAIHGPLSTRSLHEMIKSAKTNVKADVLASPAKIFTSGMNLAPLSNEEWESSVGELMEMASRRNSGLVSALKSVDATVSLIDGQKSGVGFQVEVKGHSGFLLDEIHLTTSAASFPNYPLLIKGVGGAATKVTPIPGKGGEIILRVSDRLSALRELSSKQKLAQKAGVYQYSVTGTLLPISLLKLVGRNSANGELITVLPIAGARSREVGGVMK